MRWHLRRHNDADKGKADVARAKADLARIKRQRPEVEALVDATLRERQLNSFTANALIVFRGGR